MPEVYHLSNGLMPLSDKLLGANYYLSISADGRWVAFWSYESKLVEGIDDSTGNFFMFDRQTQAIQLANMGDRTRACQDPDDSSYRWMVVPYPLDGIFAPDPQTGGVQVVNASDSILSSDGRYSVFASAASRLVPNDTQECEHPQFGRHNCADVFVCERQTGRIERISLASDGTPGNSDSVTPSLSADGRFVAFASDASNLVPNDTNACDPNPYTFSCFDIFVHDRETGATERVSLASDGTPANGDSRWPRISADGRRVAFVSRASNLVADDTNELPDVFVHDRQTGETERVSLPGSQ
ncbi:MAG TPA: hypothetical protein VJG32_18910 [Anaerolineae bacterium]|nr:hypothetical protein [Anaerolineae bacterium]